MKTLFFSLLALLVAASVITWKLQPGQSSPHPVLHWMTASNPERVKQVALFHAWLERNGYPKFELKIDTSNNRLEKIVIQGVSGVAGDIIEVQSGGPMRYLQSIGLLEDITGPAREMGFAPSATYDSIRSEITLDGRQYMFPCSISTELVLVNLDTFARAGIEPPPRSWDWATFEETGRRFVKAANPPGRRPTRFFINAVNTAQMQRSLGLDVFNETLSACILDDARNVRVLEKIRQWRDVDHILPTAEDIASFSTESGYGGAAFQLFNSGNYAMVTTGRWALIQMREFGKLNLAVSNPPHAGYPNTLVTTRAAAIYAGSKHADLARYFLKFLASEDYGMHIVESADALPSEPLLSRTDAYLKPPAHPNEWRVHEAFADAAVSTAIGYSYSPFVVPSIVTRLLTNIESGFAAGIWSAEEAARLAVRQINGEIRRTLQEQPELREDHDRRAELQKKIDDLRAAGKPVPLSWIDNPFYRKYYQDNRLADDSTAGTATR
ncbi:hypothetical protein OPIT5_09150 [Opitutaceae bacterium TAV5]|nr:hypothetical protein OPIT5_09150 [Opitutaceae bacterium TAV5]